MKWYSDLYVGPSLEDSKKEVVKRIKQNKLVFDIQLIALPVSENHILEIIPVQYTKPYPNLRVIGIAKGQQEAMEVVVKIIDEVFHSTSSFDVEAYLKEKKELFHMQKRDAAKDLKYEHVQSVKAEV